MDLEFTEKWAKKFTPRQKRDITRFFKFLRRDEKGMRQRHLNAFLAGFQKEKKKLENKGLEMPLDKRISALRAGELALEKLEAHYQDELTDRQKTSEKFEFIGELLAMLMFTVEWILKDEKLTAKHREYLGWILNDLLPFTRNKLIQHDLLPTEENILSWIHELNVNFGEDHPEKQKFIAAVAAIFEGKKVSVRDIVPPSRQLTS